MPPLPRSGLLREPLSYALGTRAKVALLRVLATVPTPLGQRDLARRARVPHRTAQVALEELVAMRLVHRLQGGREFMVSLNRSHRLGPPIAALLTAEALLFQALLARLAEAVAPGGRAPGVVSLAVFGSVARGTERLGSDLDVLLVAKDLPAREKYLDRLSAAIEPLTAEFGCNLRPIGYTVSETRAAFRRTGLLREVARDMVTVHGTPMRELLTDATFGPNQRGGSIRRRPIRRGGSKAGRRGPGHGGVA